MEKLLITCLVVLVLTFTVTNGAMADGRWKEYFNTMPNPVEEAIKNNDYQTLKRMIGDNKLKTFLNDYSYLLSLAINNNSFECRNDIVQLLLEHGAVPHEAGGVGNLTNALKNACPKIIEMLLPSLSNKEIAAVANNSWGKYFAGIVLEFSDNGSRIGESMKLVADANKSLCTNELDKSNVNCSALLRLKDEFGQLKTILVDQAKQQAYWDGPEGLMIEACSAHRRVLSNKETINEQHRIGKISGVVNKKVLYDAGSYLLSDQRELAELSKNYRKVTGKNIDFSKCPTEEE